LKPAGCLTLVALLGALIAEPARAEPAELPVSLPVDLSVTAAAGALWLVSDVVKSQLAPLTCRWCASNALDTAARDHLRWTTHGGAAVTLSNAGAFLVAPLAAVGMPAAPALKEGDAHRFWVDLLITAEAVALSGDLNQLVKYTVGRQRPYAHAGVPNPDTSVGADDANLSFYSAHTSVAFAVAAATGTVAHMRGYRWAPAVYVVGGVIGAATAYLRIAADQHYLTDVVTGAVLGTGVGAGVPYLFHRPRATSFTVTPMAIAGGRGVGCAWIW
jgi:membrane-associated phospholipid phosphatase